MNCIIIQFLELAFNDIKLLMSQCSLSTPGSYYGVVQLTCTIMSICVHIMYGGLWNESMYMTTVHV